MASIFFCSFYSYHTFTYPQLSICLSFPLLHPSHHTPLLTQRLFSSFALHSSHLSHLTVHIYLSFLASLVFALKSKAVTTYAPHTQLCLHQFPSQPFASFDPSKVTAFFQATTWPTSQIASSSQRKSMSTLWKATPQTQSLSVMSSTELGP